MRQASNKLKNKINNDEAVFYQEAKITFADGQIRSLERSDFYIDGNNFVCSAGTSTLPYGEALAKTITIILVNDDDRFSDYDFFHAKIEVWCKCDVDGEVEGWKIGTYTVTTPETYGDAIEVNAIDDMYKGDTEYSTSLEFPKDLKTVFEDSCHAAGVHYITSKFANNKFIVNSKPEGITFRQLWGMIAMLAGGNALFDKDNNLTIIPYDLSFFSREGLDGGTFSTSTVPYSDGDNADGGNFLDYSSGDNYDGGTFEEFNHFHIFYKTQQPRIATDDVVITGVKVTVNADEYISGDERYALYVSNQLISGNEIAGVELIGRNVIGMRFRPFELDAMAYPLAEFGDICYVADRKGNIYQSVVTDVVFNYFGVTSIKCAADDPVRNSSSKISALDSKVKVLKKETEEALEEIEDTIEEIDEEIEEINENVGELKISLKKTDEAIVAEAIRAKAEESAIGTRIYIAEQGLESKVSAEDIASTINQTAQSVLIDAKKIDLNGYITVTDLGKTGKTIIDGARIETGTLSCSVLSGGVIDNQRIVLDNGWTLLTDKVGNNIYDILSSWKRTNSIASASNGNDWFGVQKFYSDTYFSDDIYASGVLNSTTSKESNLFINTNTGHLGLSTASSKRYKHDIGLVKSSQLDPTRLYRIPVNEYIYNLDYLSDQSDTRYNKKVIGFIAEDIDKYYPIACEYDEYGRVENWNERYMIPPMLHLIQEQHKRMERIMFENMALNARIFALESIMEVFKNDSK